MIWEFDEVFSGYMARALDNEGRQWYAIYGDSKSGDFVLWDYQAEAVLTKSPCAMHLMANANALHEALRNK